MARDFIISTLSGKKTYAPGIVAQTYEDMIIYTGETFRNIVKGSDLLRPVHGFQAWATQVLSELTPHNDANLIALANAAATITPITDDKWKDDRVTETKPHFLAKQVGRLCWWAVRPLQIESTITDGSRTVTMASTAALTVGLWVQGPGIPLGAVVVEINSGTTITLSVPATADGAVFAVFADGGPAAAVMVDEYDTHTSQEPDAENPMKADVVWM